jgi:hypothetical protein
MDTPGKTGFRAQVPASVVWRRSVDHRNFLTKKAPLRIHTAAATSRASTRSAPAKIFAQNVSAQQIGEAGYCGDSVAVPYQARSAMLQINVITVFQFAENGRLRSMRAYWGRKA